MRLKPGEWAAVGVVVAFVAVLVVFELGPSISKAPGDQCVTNLKAVGKALSIYTSDAEGHLPPAAHWMDAVAGPYLEDLGRAECPAVRVTPEEADRLQAKDTKGLPVGYSLFQPMAGIEGPRIANAGATPMLFDSTVIEPNSVATLASLAFRHAGKVATIAFADGSAKPVTSAPAVPSPLLNPHKRRPAPGPTQTPPQ